MSGPNPIPKAEGEAEVALLYQTFGVSADRNVAYAEVDTDSCGDDLIGVSGRDSPAGTAPAPAARLFDVFDSPPGMFRGYDAEVKLLEATALAIQPDAGTGAVYPARTGTVRLDSHFTICPSCDGVIAAFRAMFPNVELSASDGT